MVKSSLNGKEGIVVVDAGQPSLINHFILRYAINGFTISYNW